jgi:hypothetical protein
MHKVRTQKRFATWCPFLVSQALLAVGHRVRLATHETFRKFVRENDLEFFLLAGDPAALMSFMVKNSGIIPSISSIAAGDLTKSRHVLTDILASIWRACTMEGDETGKAFTYWNNILSNKFDFVVFYYT